MLRNNFIELILLYIQKYIQKEPHLNIDNFQ